MRLTGLLQLPVLSGARLLTQRHTDRAIRWVAVIEWPVEDFVGDGELVLTTGLGCEPPQLHEMIDEIAAAKPAAILLTEGADAVHKAIPDTLVAIAERHRVPLVAIPWRTRFSDISRVVIEDLYAEPYAMPRPADELPGPLTRALLGAGGVTAIAAASEEVTQSPVVVLDPALAVLGAGPRGGDLVRAAANREALVAGVAALVADAGDRPRDAVVTAPGPDGGTLVLGAAESAGTGLAWIACLVAAGHDPARAERAVLHAGTAVAIDLVRGIAAAEAEERAQADFVWDLARGRVEPGHEVTVRSALLGLPRAARYRVGLGRVEQGEHAVAGAQELARRLRSRARHPHSLIAARGIEVLLCLQPGDAGLIDGATADIGRLSSVTVTLGIAPGTFPLDRLAEAAAQARAISIVSRAVHGPGRIGNTASLGSYLLLHGIVDDPLALELVRTTLAPLEESDRTRRSRLIDTATAFLAENGNISAAARRLHLNRHSLMYRLDRIAQLTGRDLNAHEDRLLLDLCLRLRLLESAQRETDES